VHSDLNFLVFLKDVKKKLINLDFEKKI